MAVQIKKATTEKEINQFIDFPHQLHSSNKNYVPELFIAQKRLFNKKKNPFFKHASADFFFAMKNGKIAGRVAVIKNGSYLQYTGENHGFMGFFDVIDDYEVAEELLNKVKEWGAQNNYSTIIGPVNFSTNDTCGLLIDGYDSPPAIMMTYNKDYQKKFIERYGYRKKMDLLAYRIVPESANEKSMRVSKALEERLLKRGITIRNMNMKDFQNEVNMLREVYNAAWEKNWGFVPMTKEEFDFAAEDMKAIVDTDFAYVAEHNGKAIGFSITIPNLNEVLIKMKRGRLFPTGLLKLLYYKNKIKSLRVLMLGVVEGYRKSGIDACFYTRNIETARRKNIKWAEASWILENNLVMNQALIKLGAEAYKKYRIYELPLS